MLYGQDYVFTSPIAFRGATIRHQDHRTHFSIDLMTLEMTALILLCSRRAKLKCTLLFDEHANSARLRVSTAKATSTSNVSRICSHPTFSIFLLHFTP